MRRQITSAAYDHFRRLFKEARISRKLTQAKLAQLLGLPQSFVSKTETGERRLDFVETAFICGVMGISFAEFATTFQERISRIPNKPRSGRQRN